MKARVYVTLKRGVLDPQGRAVETTLGRLGFDEVQGVRIGKYIEVALEETDAARARDRVAAMCEKLLANTVIEDYRVEITESGE
jgi:phosphoribosylformylglycinamidine synthase subunit PurS